jgi:hypothetical protein
LDESHEAIARMLALEAHADLQFYDIMNSFIKCSFATSKSLLIKYCLKHWNVTVLVIVVSIVVGSYHLR